MKEQPQETAQIVRPDRRLGDEWTDWDGTTQNDQPEASKKLYVWLIILMVIGLSLMGGIISWLIMPRFEQLQLAYIIKWLLLVWIGFLGVWSVMVVLTAMGLTWLRVPLKWIGGIRWSVALSMLLGSRFGVSKDKVGNAFVKLHNQLEVLPKVIKEASELLILAPRCLNRESLQGLKSLKEKYGFSQIIAIGGSEARKAIAEVRPKGIIAIACERDLLAGIKDVNGRIPVVAFTNERPEGPCKNTLIPLDSIEKTVKILLGKLL